jgi:hypothetical protein
LGSVEKLNKHMIEPNNLVIRARQEASLDNGFAMAPLSPGNCTLSQYTIGLNTEKAIKPLHNLTKTPFIYELQMRYNDIKLNLRKDGGKLTYEVV